MRNNNRLTTRTLGAAVLPAVLMTFALQGCSHGALDRRLDDKLATEAPVKDSATLQTEAGSLINSAPGLTEDQKAQLSALRASIREENNAIRVKSLKLRSILIKDMISATYDEDEVELVKTRLKDLEDQRLSVIFTAVEKANTILGREARVNHRLVDDFFLDRPGVGDSNR